MISSLGEKKQVTEHYVIPFMYLELHLCICTTIKMRINARKVTWKESYQAANGGPLVRERNGTSTRDFHLLLS